MAYEAEIHQALVNNHYQYARMPNSAFSAVVVLTDLVEENRRKLAIAEARLQQATDWANALMELGLEQSLEEWWE